MSQISPPLRILLIVAVAFLAVWMVALRPKDEAVTPAAPAANVQTGAAAQSAAGKVVQQAQGAATAAETSAVARSGEAAPATTNSVPATTAPSTTSTQGAPPAAAPSASKDSGLPLGVLRAIADKKVLAILFWNPKASDDRATRREFRKVSSLRGKVYKRVVNIKDVARYSSITRGVDLNQSPTLAVIDRKLGATSLVGYSDEGAMEQLVRDARRVKP